MKSISLLLLLLLSSINALEYSGHELVLNDAKSTIDGETVTSTPKMVSPTQIQSLQSQNQELILSLVPLMVNSQFQFQVKLT